jgi:parvulin-like peptidyl-prolyl isomerase
MKLPKGVNPVKFIYSAVFLAALSVFSVFPAFGQESEAIVIDEVVAQVNDGVITLSRIKREMKEAIDGLVQEQRKTPEAAKTEIESKQGELIANLINEELLLQRAKEEGLEQEVEAEVNRWFVQKMKENNLKKVEDLYTLMTSQGIDPQSFRETLRKQYTREMVIAREVDQKLYWGLGVKDLRDYFNANKSKFNKPENVALSTLFLNFAGRDEAAVKEKAKQLVARLRKGEDFVKLALENSDEPTIKETKGSVGKFNVPELAEVIAKAIKNVKEGGVSDPIELEGGIQILRVDQRTEASNDSVFDEDIVRRALAYEKIPDARRKYIADLRKDAYIKISEPYQAMVMPHLNKEATAEAKKPTE